MHSSKYGRVQINSSILDHEYKEPDVVTQVDITPFNPILVEEINENNFDMSAVIYVSGYAVRKTMQKIDCILCREHLYENSADNQYFQELQRGGLIVPSNKVIYLCMVVSNIFSILVSPTYKEHFLNANAHKTLFTAIIEKKIEVDVSLKFWTKLGDICNHELTSILTHLLSTFSNNYTVK